jgi:glutamate/tyrosine decarboxylase-like PLP-dependent enzyme
VELQVIDWLCGLAGFPKDAGGLMVSGGSVANLTALAAARHRRVDGKTDTAAVYLSDQTHSSVERALHILGFRREQIRKLPSDAKQRLPVSALHEAIARDRAVGLIPFFVVANAGTTNSGAVDPLPEIADLSEANSMWLHVDGAYGAGALLVESGRERLAGIERADSIALDPHKWLFQPLEAGCLLVRDPDVLRSAFRITPDYLREVHHDTEEINFCDHGIQLTRGFRALKLWLSLRIFGVAAFREAVEHGIGLAEVAESRLRRSSAWIVVTTAQLGIITFRHAHGSHLTRSIVDRANADGHLVLTSTVIAGQDVLRLCTINPRTTIEDIESSVDRLEEIAAAL